MKKIIILASLALSLGGLVSVASASHSWGGYHWARTASPFTLQVGDNVSSSWDIYLDEAISDWSVSSVLDLTKVTGSTKPRICKPKVGQIEVCSERYGNNGWLGIAQIWISGSHITKAITKVNDTYFNTSTYNTPAWRRLVMCQEIAHDFGLDHQDEDFNNPNLGSCMDYTSDPDGPLSNEHPNLHDFEELELIYSHLDTTATVGQTVSSQGNGANGQEVSDWGKAIRTDSAGRPSLFVKDFGRGEKVYTFVTWVQ